MTLHDIESVLSERGLRLRKAVRNPERRIYVVEVQDEDTQKVFEATGIDLADALSNAIVAAKRWPEKRGKHRYKN